MKREELEAVFDKQASGYDRQWASLAPIRDALHFLTDAVFARLPPDASILCVGAGTGAEIVHLARKFPGWTFTAVEPAKAMLAACRERATAEGFAERCRFHDGYVDGLPPLTNYHAATSFLVSQFIVDRAARIGYFRSIADRLAPGGILASADLSADADEARREGLIAVWMDMMSSAGMPREAQEGMRKAWRKDVAILPPDDVASIIQSAGFDTPVRFYQAALMHAWVARRRK